jgi:hypothetical protein
MKRRVLVEEIENMGCVFIGNSVVGYSINAS